MMRAGFGTIALTFVAAIAGPLCGEDEPRPTVAARVSSHIVTVRITHRTPKSADKVTVCTGVAVAPSLVVTSCFATGDDKIRLTIPGGRQAVAKLRVVDDYSGLALLSTSSQLAGIRLAEETPQVGSSITSAAGWGVEQPVVTFGTISGTERRLQKVSYPPLLQCDVRTTKASAGAAVTNHKGELVGVVTLVEREKDRQGFTYALPIKHVKRILNVTRDDQEVVVVQRRRPVVGMSLAGNLDEIRVTRIVKDGPAAKAGLKTGDRILAVDGIKIRSVYQAIQPVVYKQPGDAVQYVVQRGEQSLDLTVNLGGGAVLPNATFEQLGRFVTPKIGVSKFSEPPLKPLGPRADNVAADPDDDRTVFATDADKIKLLQKALDRYRAVILHQQGQLARERKRVRDLELKLEKVGK